jgi:hypothetical protein
MGISDYAAHPTFALGNSSSYEVAQLINTGRLNLTITGKWISENGKNLEIELFPPQPIVLVQDESLTVYAKVVHADEAGIYKGRIEFTTTAQLPDGYTGNPSTPGGTVHATFTITGDTNNTGPDLPLALIGGTGGVGAILLIVLNKNRIRAFWRRRKHSVET